MSLPSRERGLKFGGTYEYPARIRVAPFTGAWIEIRRSSDLNPISSCRSLHGSVD